MTAPSVIPETIDSLEGQEVVSRLSDEAASSRRRTKRWSLITVTFNSASTLMHHWGDIELGSDVEWIVVDNGSKDETVETAKSLGATVMALSKNIGFGAANNVGFDLSSGTFVAFVNPDVTPVMADLEHLEGTIVSTRGLVAPQLVNPDGTLQPNGRGEPYLLTKVAHRLDKDTVADRYHVVANEGELANPSWLTGAVIAGPRELFDVLGPWDDLFFLYQEDADLSLRAKKMGVPRAIDGSVQWVHAWKRETKGKFRYTPWRRELASTSKFLLRYPKYLVPKREDLRSIFTGLRPGGNKA